MKKSITFVSILSHLWVQWIMLGSMLVNTFLLYPNIFYDVPKSLETAMEFMEVASPHTYFPPIGMASIITGILALILGWKVKSARVWIFCSMLMIVIEGAISIVFEWPRNGIMFLEGTEVHSIAFLKETAKEFVLIHSIRVGTNILGSILIFIGFMKYYKNCLIQENNN
ncbi:hypothetical protein IHV09_03130 [Fictibacillus sp. 23RED33]|uniref:hypothetical protein n=1 Tax=Fictibacillus sp. 23RED33 TaxID=2745879 RepID=UPI0018CF4D27|nr:hypothetical protein [Fictibacillus sp. 23RED33]MBH0172530.1 hypothetical protein [Fictibacillus sp. 23RED33]